MSQVARKSVGIPTIMFVPKWQRTKRNMWHVLMTGINAVKVVIESQITQQRSPRGHSKCEDAACLFRQTARKLSCAKVRVKTLCTKL